VTIGENPVTFCAAACGTPQEQDITVPGFPATAGYDLASGLGTIDGPALVKALAHDNDGHDRGSAND